MQYTRVAFSAKTMNCSPSSTRANILVLLLATWIGWFHLSQSFGLYEDDIFFTAPAWSWTWTEANARSINELTHWPQGRPVGFALTTIVSFLSSRADSLLPGYLVGYAFLAGSGVLFYLLARRFFSESIALFASLVFVLYPADTSKVILMHRVFVVLNLAFVIGALIFYLKRRYILAFIAAAASFLTYEHFALPFLAAPFLVSNAGQFRWKRAALHLALFVGMVGAIAGIRLALGDSRFETLGNGEAPLPIRMATACFIGPGHSFTAICGRVRDALLHSDGLQYIVLVCAALVAAILSCKESSTSPEPAPTPETPRTSSWWLLAVGVLMWAGPYVLAVRPDNYPPVVTIGRLSQFNAPGSIGFCLALAALVHLAASRITTPLRRIGSTILGLLIGTLIASDIEIQKTDYVRNWQQQKHLWECVLHRAGPLEATPIILIDLAGDDPARPATSGFPLYWVVNYAPSFLPQLLEAPTAEGAVIKPRVFGLWPDLPSELSGEDVLLHNPPWAESTTWPRLRDHQFVLFGFREGRLVRLTQPITLCEKALTPRAEDPAGHPPKLSRLGRLLFNEQPDSTWPSVQGARNYPR